MTMILYRGVALQPAHLAAAGHKILLRSLVHSHLVPNLPRHRRSVANSIRAGEYSCLARMRSNDSDYNARPPTDLYVAYATGVPLSTRSILPAPFLKKTGMYFHTVGDYHDVADETLNSIQDVVEDYLEEYFNSRVTDDEEDVPELNCANGVLTIYLPPHGTWVINKQTPNQQLWWSSPISGPRRYEFDAKRERWVYSRVLDEGNDACDVDASTYSEEDTLGGILNKEFEDLYGKNLGIDDDFHC